MKKLFKTTIAIVFCLFLLPLNAYSIDVSEFNLDNGLKVLIVEEHKAPVATFQVWYRVGSRNEATGKTGLSHLLEHMMFKGTKKFGPKTFSQTIKRAGGQDNAFTTREYTGYFEVISADRIDILITLEADRMHNLVLTQEAVLSERDVVMEERRMRFDDDPQNLLYEKVMEASFKNHPYRLPVIGWMQDLQNLNPEDLIDHYKKYYTPGNAVVIVVGDVDTKKTLALIKESFGKIPKGPEMKESRFIEDEQKGEKRLYVKKEAELPHILSTYRVPDIKHQDGSALEVLGSILSGGKSSRLYNALVYEKQLAISASAWYDGNMKEPFLFFVDATAAQGKRIEDVESALLEEFEKIKKEPPTEHELQKAKNQIEAYFIMSQDSVYNQAKIIGTFEMIGGWKLRDKYLEGIRKVTTEDVKRAAEKYLTADRRTTGILVPVKEIK